MRHARATRRWAGASVASSVTGGGRRAWLGRTPGVAAALLAGLLLGRAIPFDAPAAMASAEFHTGAGEMATAALDDGTVVRLGPDTRLRVVIGADSREVWLDGRAFFAVARDPRRTFRVRTALGAATVLGTRFEIDTREEGLELLVVDGRVAVSSGQNEVHLRAGELARAQRGSGTSVIEVPDPESRLDWLGAFIAFESTPLHRVARELEVRLGLAFAIADSAVAKRTVTAWFDEEDLDEIVRVICRAAGVQCRTAAGVIHMEVAS